MTTASSLKETFITELKKVERPGINNLITWLETTDFFTAPASTSTHNNCKYGLLVHSLNVYYSFKFDYIGIKSLQNYKVPDIPEESMILCCLLHDLCKVNTFKEIVKTVTVGNKTEKQIGYIIEDDFPMGCGAKSIHYIEKFIKLTDEEAQAIASFRGNELSNAFNTNFLAFLLNRANMLAKHFNENKLYKKSGLDED